MKLSDPGGMLAGMTWTAPQIERVEPPLTADERASLDGFLDYHRQILLWKCSGPTAEQLRRAASPPAKLTLLGLLRHLTEVEHGWFSVRVGRAPESWVYCTDARPDADFDDIATADPAADYAAYLAQCQRSREVVAGLPLEFTFVHPRSGEEMSLRWTYLHMIEEYARHNGHADLIREAIDGATGE